MLQPARTKYRKQQKGRNTGIATRGAKVSFGEYGLKAIGRGRLTARQIEAARRAMTRHIKRGGESGLEFFLISQSLISLLKLEWVKVKEILNILWLKYSLERCCMKWMELMKN